MSKANKDTKGIEGVHRFLKKLWRLFYDEQKGKIWTEENPSAAELKVLHRTIKKIGEDTERFSFNTAVSAFMIAVNELIDLQCHKKAILENILVLLTPMPSYCRRAVAPIGQQRQRINGLPEYVAIFEIISDSD